MPQMYFLNGRWMTVGEASEFSKQQNAKINRDIKEAAVEINPLKCPYCGRECKNKLGFNKHVEACKKKATK